MRSLAFFLGGVLLASAAYELALALGVSHVGSQPGEGVAGSGIVEAIALLTMVVGIVFALLAGSFVVGVLTWRRPSVGGLLTAGALFVCGVTALFAGDGH